MKLLNQLLECLRFIEKNFHVWFMKPKRFLVVGGVWFCKNCYTKKIASRDIWFFKLYGFPKTNIVKAIKLSIASLHVCWILVMIFGIDNYPIAYKYNSKRNSSNFIEINFKMIVWKVVPLILDNLWRDSIYSWPTILYILI